MENWWKSFRLPLFHIVSRQLFVISESYCGFCPLGSHCCCCFVSRQLCGRSSGCRLTDYTPFKQFPQPSPCCVLSDAPAHWNGADPLSTRPDILLEQSANAPQRTPTLTCIQHKGIHSLHTYTHYCAYILPTGPWKSLAPSQQGGLSKHQFLNHSNQPSRTWFHPTHKDALAHMLIHIVKCSDIHLIYRARQKRKKKSLNRKVDLAFCL